MPYGDRTGPEGMGPRTGRGAGYCSGYGMPGYMNNTIPRRGGGGFGGGRAGYAGRGGFGGGRGFRNRFGGGYAAAPYYGAAPYAPPAAVPEQELEFLKSQLSYMQRDTESIQSRIAELEAKGSSDKDEK